MFQSRYLSACLLALSGYLPSTAHALPTPEEVQASYMPSETLLLSREGVLLHRLRTHYDVRRGHWIALQDISPALRLALLASEDQRFYAHSGIDWQAVSAAAWGNLWHSKTRGASTITMQLAGLLDEDWQNSTQRRSIGQKLGQAVAATRLERNWRKDEILETYLNLVPFRGELVGLDALSRTLFGKAPHGLDMTEAAIAAALIRGPNATASVVAQRACGVLQAMHTMREPLGQTTSAYQTSAGNIPVDCTSIHWRTEQILAARQWPASEGIAAHWARRAMREATQHSSSPPAQLRTTLQADVQRIALESLQRHLRELQGRNVEDGAVLVLDNRNGEVLAWVGSSGSLSQAQEVDSVLALRQPGSTLKPFLYAQAIAQRRLTAASLIEDSAAHINTASGLYIPQNYDRRFKGWVSVRMALAASLNVPAVRTLVMVSPDDFHRQLRDFGLELPQPAGYYGYSLALGSAETSLLALTNAYRALANAGQWHPVASAILPAPSQTASSQTPTLDTVRAATTAQAAFIVGDILSDAQARATTFGLDSVLTTRFWSAVKTGTSKDMRDNWAIGWSQHYTVGVWVGNASGSAMHHVSGSSGAAPVWADVMTYLHKSQSSHAPTTPKEIVRQAVQFIPSTPGQWSESNRHEWFLQGTQQAQFHIPAVLPSTTAKILQPAAGTIIALDPDIPPLRQRLLLRASQANVRWQLDAQFLGQGRELTWLPMPGKHHISLTNTRGDIVDQVRIEVRGAGLRQTQTSTNTSHPNK